MKRLERPVSNFIKTRGYVTQAATQQFQQSAPASHEPQVSRLQNGTVVVSLENNSPLARIGVSFHAGPRFEAGNNIGVTHAIRNACSLSTKNASQFGLTRHVQQIGGNISCSTTREHMTYTLECTRGALNVGMPFLAEAAAAGIFFPWEVKELVVPSVKHDMEILARSPEIQLIEQLFKSAYRKGPTNSLYMPLYSVGSHTPEMMCDYLDANYTTGNMCVVGTGIKHSDLKAFANKLGADHLEEGSQAVQKAQFHGDQRRLESQSDVVHAAIVTEGASMDSPDMMPLAVLQHLMGASGPHVKYGTCMASSKLATAVAGATSEPFSVNCLNAVLSDTGLFGFQVSANAKDMGQVLTAGVKAMSDATKGVSDQDVTRGKALLKSSLLMNLEDSAASLNFMGYQAFMTGQVMSKQQMVDAVDAVTTQQVQSVAKKVINSKPTMAAVGNLQHTPYLDELL